MMKYGLVDLKKLMKENGIKGRSVLLKQEMIDLLREKQLLPEFETKQPLEKPIKPQYEYLRNVRKNPRPVTLENIETGEITSYPSLYRAGRSLRKNPRTVLFFHDKIMDGKYKVTVHEQGF